MPLAEGFKEEIETTTEIEIEIEVKIEIATETRARRAGPIEQVRHKYEATNATGDIFSMRVAVRIYKQDTRVASRAGG